MKEQCISHQSAKTTELREVNCCCYGNKSPANCFSSIVFKQNWLVSWMLHIWETSLALGWRVACNTGFPNDGVCAFDVHFVIRALSVIPSLGFPFISFVSYFALISHLFLSFLSLVLPPKSEIGLK